jgi:hypothetical protein
MTTKYTPAVDLPLTLPSIWEQSVANSRARGFLALTLLLLLLLLLLLFISVFLLILLSFCVG